MPHVHAALRLSTVATLLIALLACGGNDVRELNEVCVECADDHCNAQIRLPCVEGTYCHLNGGKCRPYLTAGETCSAVDLCDPALECTGAVCREPGALGASCAYDPAAGVDPCVEGTCAWGGPPDGPRLGVCAPPAQLGDTCSFASVSAQPQDAAEAGCDVGLVCQPTHRAVVDATGLQEPAADPCWFDASTCGYPGVCIAAASAADGALCVTHGTCASGVCSVPEPPRAVSEAPGFGCFSEPTCLDALWTGTCLADGEVGHGGGCDDQHPCAADLRCSYDEPRVCVGRLTRQAGARCAPVAAPEQTLDDLCAVGLVCRSGDDGARCVVP